MKRSKEAKKHILGVNMLKRTHIQKESREKINKMHIQTLLMKSLSHYILLLEHFTARISISRNVSMITSFQYWKKYFRPILTGIGVTLAS